MSQLPCCSGGPFTSDRFLAGRPALPFGTESILMIVFFACLLLGGILNNWSPAFIKPKGVLGPIFYQRLGTAMYLRYTPVEFLAVLLVLGFYVARFIGFYRTYEPYETAMQTVYPNSLGPARAAAQALEEVYYSMLPMQVSLGVKNMFWVLLAGLPVERSAAYHAWHGYLMQLVYMAVWICYAIGGLTTRHFLSPFCFCDVNPLSGIIGLFFSTVLTLMSLPIVRRKYWEYFYLMGHMQLLFPLFWAVLINNRVAVFPWFVVTAAQWGMSDVALRFYMKVLQHTKVISVEAKGDIVIMRCTKAYNGAKQTLGVLTSRWEAGSYIWLAVRMEGANPLVGKAPPPFNKPWACYHPITISSPPVEPDGTPAKDFTMHIKSMGPGTWSEALLTKARKGESPDTWKVWVGGPNGKLSINPFDCDKVVLCGGGIGCTPMLALAQDLHYKSGVKGGKPPPMVEYVHTERELSSYSVYKTHLELFGSSDVITPRLYCTSKEKNELLEGGSMKASGVAVSAGRPNFATILKEAAAPSAGGVSVLKDGTRIIGVYACGPRGMMASVREAVQAASAPGVKFYLHEETYEL